MFWLSLIKISTSSIYYPKISLPATSIGLILDDFQFILFQVRPAPTHSVPKLSRICFNLFHIEKWHEIMRFELALYSMCLELLHYQSIHMNFDMYITIIHVNHTICMNNVLQFT